VFLPPSKKPPIAVAHQKHSHSRSLVSPPHSLALLFAPIQKASNSGGAPEAQPQQILGIASSFVSLAQTDPKQQSAGWPPS